MYRNVHGDVMFWSFLSLPGGFMFYDNSERVFSLSDGHLTVIGECCASVVNIASSNFFIFLFIM